MILFKPQAFYFVFVKNKNSDMKTKLLLCFHIVLAMLASGLKAQVTQINSNKSLGSSFALSANKSIFISGADQTIWATDGTLAGTIQLSPTLIFANYLGSLGYLNGSCFFAATNATTGTELYVTDGTPAGTLLVKDINPGVAGSSPDIHTALVNGFLYFTAETATTGRELWRTDGTAIGTTLVKDIVAGPGGSNYPGKYYLYSLGTTMLFMARTLANGVELWKSDGTDAGTILLKDINTGSDSSGINLFYSYNNNIVLFNANNGVNGTELWKSDGTTAGTVLVKDINPGPASSVSFFGLGLANSTIFNGYVYFTASDGVSGQELWRTDGTAANTTLVKDIETGPGDSFDFLVGAVRIGNKFIFSSTNLFGTRFQMWQSDGTTTGTTLFKDFDGGELPLIFTPYAVNNPQLGQVLFQGNKFFFVAATAASGYELWISDGVDSTPAHTNVVREIGPAAASGIDQNFITYTYTSGALFFPANTTAHGTELWKSDGTSGGTTEVADIVTGSVGCKPAVEFFIVNQKVLFEADNGDDPLHTDLYAVDGVFTPLPVSLLTFTVKPARQDAILEWTTSQELNSKNFIIQRSIDGLHFQDIGTIAAAGSSSVERNYSFTDYNIMNSGNKIVYYRLASTDNDGRSGLSGVIPLKIKANDLWTVSLLGNPVKNYLRLLFNGAMEDIRLSVFDMNGKKLLATTQRAINGQLSVPVTELSDGNYILMIETGNERKSLKFVK